ncbi:hypothetical protein BC828DRAFT_403232 [Blastocladiella britannica]|nr:hypothetical protein BC828DRAFT_403232 [Blastocladiella britannica]
MGHLAVVATCSLKQWALDFTGNRQRILRSLDVAAAKGASLRIGPELEIPGYGCNDHFHEPDTEAHSWQVLVTLLQHPALASTTTTTTRPMIATFGMPVHHRGANYNCQVVVHAGKIVLIRPKMHLANDGNYRELRWFTPWTRVREIEDHVLPGFVAAATGQSRVPFGDAVIETLDTVIGIETCEEVFAAASPHVPMALDGAEVFLNSSGSHHELRKLRTRLDLVCGATRKVGGVYVYANLAGCDGERVYYDASSMVAVNGAVVQLARQFSLADVDVLTATVDLDHVRAFRSGRSSSGMQAAAAARYPRVRADLALARSVWDTLAVAVVPGQQHPLLPRIISRSASSSPSAMIAAAAATVAASDPAAHPPVRALPAAMSASHGGTGSPFAVRPDTPIANPPMCVPEEEIALGPACWLWDYLRRSRTQGFFLPLSGGIDSCATAVIVYSMCRLVHAACHDTGAGADAYNRDVVRSDARRIAGMDGDWVPNSPQDLCGRIFHSSYLGSAHSSAETRGRAADLANAIGAYHLQVPIDGITSALLTVFSAVTGKTPRFKVHGGSTAENLALQNIQARSRMVVSYLLAQLLCWVRGREGGLLVLGSANVDESLRGYLTKYDCSSADLNPIGGISKTDLRQFIGWAQDRYDLPVLGGFLDAVPTAELEPITATYTQADEADMGMTYAELSEYGRLRKIGKNGPFSMFAALAQTWGNAMPAHEVAAKVKRFWTYYAINRHKMTTLTPSYHAEAYGTDDNRFDLRPFLYPARFEWQFGEMDAAVRVLEAASSGPAAAAGDKV